MYCFEDADDNSRVVLHVHTPIRWGDRTKDAKARAAFITSANVRHAWRQRDQKAGPFEQEQTKWFLVPLDERLKHGWHRLAHDQITWRWDKPGSMPPAERQEPPCILNPKP